MKTSKSLSIMTEKQLADAFHVSRFNGDKYEALKSEIDSRFREELKLQMASLDNDEYDCILKGFESATWHIHAYRTGSENLRSISESVRIYLAAERDVYACSKDSWASYQEQR